MAQEIIRDGKEHDTSSKSALSTAYLLVHRQRFPSSITVFRFHQLFHKDAI